LIPYTIKDRSANLLRMKFSAAQTLCWGFICRIVVMRFIYVDVMKARAQPLEGGREPRELRLRQSYLGCIFSLQGRPSLAEKLLKSGCPMTQSVFGTLFCVSLKQGWRPMFLCAPAWLYCYPVLVCVVV